MVAAAILEAATDTSYKLRYMPNGQLILAARRIFGPSLYLRRSRRLLKLKA